MKPNVTKKKNVRGRIVGYAASIGPIEASGATPAQAVEACEREALWALERLDRGASVLRWRERMIIAMPCVSGWCYWFDGLSDKYFNATNASTREDAEDNALHHLAQNLWTSDVDDAAFVKGLPPSVAKEISGWIRFQRGYAKAKARGMSDNDAHRAGCEASSRYEGSAA